MADRGHEVVLLDAFLPQAHGTEPRSRHRFVADPEKAARVLGFRASVDFADGVRAFAHAPLREPAAFGRGER
ncbi:hypothetical protein SAMN05216215_106422 [Saccharopolyspora shandongensis]|uniref:UDP-glucose 4-epimerase n=1 Tax=Saccharopolyspora shandongensis TaxID=418495 RepID=A0A1H3SFY6_9PSEU|nr:hypothetical protein SAMN05216215_106422 [Saccharopolyspora shandongensis]